MSDTESAPTRRPPRPPTARQLREIARRYVERYIPSVAQTEAVLWRKVRRANGLLRDGSDPAPVIDAIITEFCARRILDDDRLAHALVREYHRRGDPQPKMRSKLMRKRVPFDIIDRALRTLDDTLKADGIDPRRQRALAYARRRRLGPWRRDPAKRSARREKDLAALGRAGVPWGLAKEIVDHTELELLEAELDAIRR